MTIPNRGRKVTLLNQSQNAPYPALLLGLVERLKYKPGWLFRLVDDMERGQGSQGLTLVITTQTQNSYHPELSMRVSHLMIVPAASYDERSWRRWLLDQLLLVESHECCEFFEVDGERPFAPNHGPGRNPYDIVEYATDEDRRTSFRGDLNDERTST